MKEFENNLKNLNDSRFNSDFDKAFNDDGLELVSMTESFLETGIDVCSIKGGAPLIIEAALNIFDKIGMAMFDKFNKVEDLLKEDMTKFKSLATDIKKSDKKVYYKLDVDFVNLAEMSHLLLDIYNDAVNGTAIFTILSKPDVTANKFDNDEYGLYRMMDTDIRDTKKLLKQVDAYKNMKDITFSVSRNNLDMVHKNLADTVKTLTDINNARTSLKNRIGEYSKAINAANNPNIPNYHARLTKLVTTALHNSIYILNQTMKVYAILINARKSAYHQIRKGL